MLVTDRAKPAGTRKQRQFMLRVFGDLKYEQIASLFKKTDSWARVTFYRAKMELQKRIKEEENG